MAADILLYDATLVPTGQDQKQHVEFARDIAGKFNNMFGETFILPDSYIQKDVSVVPGIDGRKMSKSYKNFIGMLEDDKTILKKVKQIATDATPIEEPKNPDTCNVFALYKLLGTAENVADLRAKYEAGNYGYGHAKQALYELITIKFKTEREKYNYYINNLEEVDKLLLEGAAKAGIVANNVLKRVREKLGY